ncbi:hypothetical protein TTHERM_00295820 (macronuclear) [Tetrahymena thermophila SB210]|uniref:Uncharacterized protein n=1 Tax=Tetrahymena thermophila (strain SB210) TaxID=312017 RepID=I7M0Z0_TETTS|nr:hypothetical protein TTHERM_00295820 [Tetrahymena thermophila SB210]EAR92969.3 hypothetical protein TTHERM_00295820 [Tetrahymena thermophila SB210]|eukprot:XP_001013214.3 hypothetical protein TTHERM_00295820 [Tetrahymena thermophila SB210]
MRGFMQFSKNMYQMNKSMNKCSFKSFSSAPVFSITSFQNKMIQTQIKNALAQSIRVSYQFNGERFANMIDFSLLQELEESNDADDENMPKGRNIVLN